MKIFVVLAVMVFAQASDQIPSSDPIVGWLATASATTLLAVAVLAFMREWIVPGSRYRRVEQENDEIRTFMRDQAIPTLIRVQELLVKALEERAWDERLRRTRPKS